jgi:hypothetical protein
MNRLRQQLDRLLASLKIFNSLLNWLAGFFQLTEEEQKDAGIDLGNQRY